MMREFPERDWKVFREVRAAALDRYCAQVLSEFARIVGDETKSAHERYLSIWKLMKERDKALADAFDNPRRSQAFIQLAMIYSLGVIPENDVNRFTPETQQALALLTGLHD